jgi:hypothetical protein
MKKLIAAAGLGAALLGAGTGIAHADAGTYVSDVRDAGFTNIYGNGALLNQGYWICGQLNLGATPNAVATSLYWQNNISDFDSGTLVGIAVRELCTAHYGQGFYESRPLLNYAA